MRRLSLTASKIALVNATIIFPALLIAAAVVLFTGAGNFPTPRDRALVAAMFCFFALVTLFIRHLTRKRIDRLQTVIDAEKNSREPVK